MWCASIYKMKKKNALERRCYAGKAAKLAMKANFTPVAATNVLLELDDPTTIVIGASSFSMAFSDLSKSMASHRT